MTSWRGHLSKTLRDPYVWGLLLALGLNALLLASLRSLAVANAPNRGHDFLLLYSAAHALRDHQNPYDPSTMLRYAQASGLPLLYVVDGSGRLNQPYVYPPLFGWLVSPLTLLRARQALLVWRVFSAACVFAGTYGLSAAWRDEVSLVRTRARRLLVSGLSMVAPVTVYGLYWGNPVLLVYGAMGGWVWLLSRRGKRTDLAAGALMSVALLKPQLALMLALFSAACFLRGEGARQRMRSVGKGFAGAALVLLALDLLTTGPGLLLVDWPRSVRSLAGMTSLQPDMPSLLGLLQPSLRRLPAATYSMFSLLVVALTVAAALTLYWLLRTRLSPAILFGLLAAVWCFGSPYAHANDDILFIPGGLALLALLGAFAARLVHAGSPAPRRDTLRAAQPALEYLVRGLAQLLLLALLGLLSLVALLSLYMGGVAQYLHVGAHHLRTNVVIALMPCLLLLALAASVIAMALPGASSRRVLAGANPSRSAPRPEHPEHVAPLP